MWHKVEFAPHPCFLSFFNVFIGFVECSMGCGKMSTLRHTLRPINTRAVGGQTLMNIQGMKYDEKNS